MRDASDAEITARSDVLLSIVPPAEALRLAIAATVILAAFIGTDRPEHRNFDGAASLDARLANETKAPEGETRMIYAFLARSAD